MPIPKGVINYPIIALVLAIALALGLREITKKPEAVSLTPMPTLTAYGTSTPTTAVTPTETFSPSPIVSTSGQSGIRGSVILGPTCPVERIPPDPQCAPKPYQTSIDVVHHGENAILATIQSDNLGKFFVALQPGTYDLQAHGGSYLPRCPVETIEIIPQQIKTITISCDTGIR